MKLFENEIEEIYKNLPILDRKKIFRYTQITHGSPTTKQEFKSLLSWITFHDYTTAHLPDDIFDRILKECGKTQKICFTDSNLSVELKA